MQKYFLIYLLVFLIAACTSVPDPVIGENIAVLKGCTSCHSVDGSTKIAPPWRGIYGSQVELADGTIITADEKYIIESINTPDAKIVKGYTKGAMPTIYLTEDEIANLIAYIKTVK